jgi:predicted nucleic acid-binding protein
MVLVDSSVWIEYFKGNERTLPLNRLFDFNTVCINDLILAELLPSINQKKETVLKELLLTITKIPLTINWNTIIYMQTQNLKNGLNKVGIADLIIAQNVMDNDLELFSLDRHFEIMSTLHDFRLFSYK